MVQPLRNANLFGCNFCINDTITSPYNFVIVYSSASWGILQL